MLHKIGLAIVAVIIVSLATMVLMETTQTHEAGIPFAPKENTKLKDPDNPTVRFRVDLAKVEHDVPLSRTDLTKLTPEILANMTQEQIDQIYGRITAGPIPDGRYGGDLFFARGDEVRPLNNDFKVRIEEAFGGIKGRLVGTKLEFIEKIGRRLWKGKLFYRNRRILRNMIEDLKPVERIIDDPDRVMTTKIPRKGWTGWFSWILPANRVSLLFPAKLFCGQSLIDSRRESIIIDYLYNDDIEGYQKSPDSLAGRGGLKIRDEIRMVRPGLYLGRAYANRVFLLNFVLFNKEVADAAAKNFLEGKAILEDCWPGEQQRSAKIR